jgi:hypothetical protein
MRLTPSLPWNGQRLTYAHDPEPSIYFMITVSPMVASAEMPGPIRVNSEAEEDRSIVGGEGRRICQLLEHNECIH